MSKHEQGGAEGFKTKAALRAACKAEPDQVCLYSTSAFGGYSGPATDLPDGLVFNVVGPDPYRNRKWYASVFRNGDKVVVK